MDVSAIKSSVSASLQKTKKEVLNSKLGKWFTAGMLSAFIACFAAFSCFATDPEPSAATITDMSSTLVAAFGSLATTLQSYIGAVLPVGIGIMGTIFAIRFGINFFMSLTHREH